MGDKGDKGFNPEAKFDFGVGGKGGDIIDLQKNPFMMQALIKQIQESKPDISHLHPNVRRRVYALKNLHKSTTALEKQYKEEVRALDRKYHALYEPLFAKRAQFVNGDIEPTEEEAKTEDAGKEEDAEVEENKVPDEELEDGKGIPSFWLTVMQNNRSVSETITPADEDALTSLVDIRSTPLDGAVQGFTLSFHFTENPYFSNNILTKTYYLADDEISGDLVFDRVEASKIDWKPSKNLTVKLVTKKQRSKGGRGRKPQVRTKTVEQPIKSFFRFFSPPTWNEEEELEDDEQEELDALLEFDFNLGCIFKDKLIRQAALWFTGEAIDEDEYGDFDEGEFEGDDDVPGLVDEDDEDDEEEEEEDPRPKSKKGQGVTKQHGGAKPSAANTQQPECKQQ